MAYVCGICGESHEGRLTDIGYQLPDVVWAIPKDEREQKAKFSRDLCQFGDRYFIRCLLALPFVAEPGDFGWGIWVEVEWPVFQRYLELYEQDGRDEPPHPATIANALPAYDQSLGLTVTIQFQEKTERPKVHFAPDAASVLALEQRNGIDEHRYHELIAAG